MAESMEEARRLAHATESTEGAAVVFALLAVAEELARQTDSFERAERERRPVPKPPSTVCTCGMGAEPVMDHGSACPVYIEWVAARAR